MANLLSTLSWILLIHGTSALPSVRCQDPSPMMDPQQLTQQAMDGFLQGLNLKNGTSVHFQPWTPIDFAGASSVNLTGPQINKILFATCDPVGQTLKSFSKEYTSFLQEINKRLPKQDGNNTELNEAIKIQGEQCLKLANVLSQGIAKYMSGNPTITAAPATSDPTYVQWASANYMPYAEANNICTGAKNNVSKIQDMLYGDNGEAFAVADTIINIFDETKPENQPGINMPISDDSAIPDYRPEYYLPLLNNTMEAEWHQSFRDNHMSTTSGGGGISFIWEDVLGDGSGEGSTTTTNSSQKAQAFSLTFGGITALPIEYGIWFDDYRLAGAAENPPKGDNVSALAQPVFDDFFGTADKPGRLSRYNSQIVIGYLYQQLKSASAGAQVCFLFICAGGHGTSSSNHTTTDDKSNSISFQDTTNNIYILGFIMKSYWGPN